jgi:hypothetical protein
VGLAMLFGPVSEALHECDAFGDLVCVQRLDRRFEERA